MWRKQSWPNLRYYPDISLEVLKRIKKNRVVCVEPLFKHGAFPRQVIRSSLLKHKLLGYLILVLESNWVLSLGILCDSGFGKCCNLIHCHSQHCQIIYVIAHHEVLNGKCVINSSWYDCNVLVVLWFFYNFACRCYREQCQSSWHLYIV
jgi:hypothetical protein